MFSYVLYICLTLLQSVYVFCYVINNVALDVSKSNVTGCFGRTKYHLGIYPNLFLNRFEANTYCKDNGFSEGLFTSPLRWKRWNHIRDELITNGFSYTNITFLDARFRPYFYVNEWYDNTWPGSLIAMENDLVQFQSFEQCAVVHFNNLKEFSVDRVVSSVTCDAIHPFICNDVDDFGLDFDAYNGYSVDDPNLYGLTPIYNTTNNETECGEICFFSTHCMSFSYVRATNECISFYARGDAGPITYLIKNSSVDVIHGVKTGCSAAVYNTSNDDLSNVNLTVKHELPACGYSGIPPGYIMYSEPHVVNETELEKTAEEIIRNLTVPRQSTTRYQQQFYSKYEGRAYSVSMGVLGITVIVAVISIVIMCDLFKIPKNKPSKRKRKKTARKPNIEINNREAESI